MKKLILLILTFIYLQAQPHTLEEKYLMKSNTIYSDELFQDLNVSFEIFTMPNNSFVYKVPANNIINKFKDYSISVEKPNNYYITFEKEMVYDSGYIKSYIAQTYKEHIKSLNITDIELEATLKTDLAGFSIDNISIDKYSLDKNNGTISVKFIKDMNFKKIYFKYKVIGSVKLAIATKNIDINEPISNYNISIMDVPFQKNVQSINAQDLSNNICAKELIPANSVIRLNHIKKIPLVKKGSIVTAFLKDGALQVEFEAIALEDGSKKEFISVKRIDNGNIYKGIVISSSSVRIH